MQAETRGRNFDEEENGNGECNTTPVTRKMWITFTNGEVGRLVLRRTLFNGELQVAGRVDDSARLRIGFSDGWSPTKGVFNDGQRTVPSGVHHAVQREIP